MRLSGRGSQEAAAAARTPRRRPTPARRLRSNRRLARRSRGSVWPRRVALLGAVGLGFAAGLLWPRLPEPPAGAPQLAAMRAAVSGHRWLAPAEVARLAGVAAGTPLFQVQPEAVAERLQAHPWVAAARVAVLAPGELLLSVQERVPAARVRVDDAAWWVDAAGVPFAPAGAPLNGRALPELRGAPATPGQASEELAAAVALLGRIAERPVGEVRALQIGDAPADQLPILEIQGLEAPLRVLLGADLPGALERLEQLLAAGLGELGRAREIDVRFGDQAILREMPLADTRADTDTRAGAERVSTTDSRGDAASRGDAPPRVLGARG